MAWHPPGIHLAVHAFRSERIMNCWASRRGAASAAPTAASHWLPPCSTSMACIVASRPIPGCCQSQWQPCPRPASSRSSRSSPVPLKCSILNNAASVTVMGPARLGLQTAPATAAGRTSSRLSEHVPTNANRNRCSGARSAAQGSRNAIRRLQRQCSQVQQFRVRPAVEAAAWNACATG